MKVYAGNFQRLYLLIKLSYKKNWLSSCKDNTLFCNFKKQFSLTETHDIRKYFLNNYAYHTVRSLDILEEASC